MKTYEQKIVAARRAGGAAFRRGRPCIPAMDKAVDTLLEGMPIGTRSIDILKAWHRGWTVENLMPG